MHCEQSETLLALMALDELDAGQRAELQAHLDACPACREKLGDLRVTLQLLQEAVSASPAPTLSAGRVAALEKAAAEALSGPLVRFARRLAATARLLRGSPGRTARNDAGSAPPSLRGAQRRSHPEAPPVRAGWFARHARIIGKVAAAILLVFASALLLMPSFQRSRCINNLRLFPREQARRRLAPSPGHVVKADTSYQESSGDFFPAAPDSSASSWSLLYPRYREALKVFAAPSAAVPPIAADMDGTSWRGPRASGEGGQNILYVDGQAAFKGDNLVSNERAEKDASSRQSGRAGHDSGQNVRYFDGHVKWRETQYASDSPRDDIRGASRPTGGPAAAGDKPVTPGKEIYAYTTSGETGGKTMPGYVWSDRLAETASEGRAAPAPSAVERSRRVDDAPPTPPPPAEKPAAPASGSVVVGAEKADLKVRAADEEARGKEDKSLLGRLFSRDKAERQAAVVTGPAPSAPKVVELPASRFAREAGKAGGEALRQRNIEAKPVIEGMGEFESAKPGPPLNAESIRQAGEVLKEAKKETAARKTETEAARANLAEEKYFVTLGTADTQAPGTPPPPASAPVPATPPPPLQPAPEAKPVEVKDAEIPAPVFRAGPVNPWVMTEQDRFSTFGIDVDTASYAIARAYIGRGYLPPAASVRMEEYVNAFDYNYPAPERETFAVHAEAAPSPFGRGLTLLKIGIRGKVLGRDGRKPAHLVFVVDASGSMERADRLPLVKYALKTLAGQLDPNDRVSVVAFGTRAMLVLEAAPASESQAILDAIDGIRCSGSTNMMEGLRLGYEMAQRGFRSGGVNRVILCSDGVANVGPDDADQMLRNVEAFRHQGIAFTGVGFGSGQYNDVLMERLADRGDGNYVFVDSEEAARRVFVEDFAATLHMIAKDVKIQVAFDPSRVRRYRLIGFENRDIADEDFRNDAIDAGEVGSGQSSTALYELELLPAAGRLEDRPDLGAVFVRYRSVETGQVEEICRPLPSSLVRARTPQDSPRFFLAACAAEFAEILRQSEHAKDGSLAEARRIMEHVAAQLPLDARAQELLALVRKAEGLPRAQ